MTWTLWRGDDLLGELYARPARESGTQDPEHIAAVLVPNRAHLPLPSVRQHLRDLPGGPVVIEHARPPQIAGVRPGAPQEPALAQTFVVLTPGAPRPAGVPPAERLRVSDAAGQAVPTTYISVLEFRPHPDHPPDELAALPAGVLVGGSVWLVDFVRTAGAPAA